MAKKHFISVLAASALVHFVHGAAFAAGSRDAITAANSEFEYGAGWRQTGDGAKAGLDLVLSRQVGPLYQSAGLTYSAGHTLDADVRMGATFNVGGQAAVTPYVGYGYRRWTNASYQSLGLGWLLQQAAGQDWVIATDLAVAGTFDGQARSADFGTARLPAGIAGRVGVSADYALTHLTHVKASYRVERLWAGQPAGQTGNWRATTQTVMLNLAVAY